VLKVIHARLLFLVRYAEHVEMLQGEKTPDKTTRLTKL
jgi:hypothetical protein